MNELENYEQVEILHANMHSKKFEIKSRIFMNSINIDTYWNIYNILKYPELTLSQIEREAHSLFLEQLKYKYKFNATSKIWMFLEVWTMMFKHKPLSSCVSSHKWE